MHDDEEVARLAREGLIDAVEQQVAQGRPPEAPRTLQRLRDQGYPREEAVRLMAAALAAEAFEVLNQQREYDEESYVRLLKRLPQAPGE